MYTVGNLWIQ